MSIKHEFNIMGLDKIIKLYTDHFGFSLYNPVMLLKLFGDKPIMNSSLNRLNYKMNNKNYCYRYNRSIHQKQNYMSNESYLTKFDSCFLASPFALSPIITPDCFSLNLKSCLSPSMTFRPLNFLGELYL